jgi:PAS domain S-box-containing protein
MLTRLDDEQARPRAILAVTVDLTASKAAQRALAESEERMRRAIEIETVGIIFFHLNGRITEANEAFLRMTGYDRSDLAAGRLRWDRMTPPEWMPHLLQAMQEFKSLGRTRPYEQEFMRKDGTRWWALFASTRLGPEEGVEYLIDITERKAAEEELRRAREDLEVRVHERTAEAEAVNGALRDEIIERQRSESARQALLRQLVTAQEEERRRISRELHDEVGQLLTALMLGLKSIRSTTTDVASATKLEQLHGIAEQVGREVHEMALALRPTALDDIGLLRTLSNYVEQWSTRANIEVDFHSSGWTGERLPPHIETTLYRIVQEALTNVLKHARASRVSLIVERRPDQAIVVIEDDGQGFNPELVDQRSSGKCLGLLGMKERAALVDGEVNIESSRGNWSGRRRANRTDTDTDTDTDTERSSGTTIFVRIPLPKKISPSNP